MPPDAARFVMGLDNNLLPVEDFRKRFRNKPNLLENAVESLRVWAESEGLTGDDLTIIKRGKNKKAMK